MRLFLRIAAALAIILPVVATISTANAAILHLGNVTIGQSGSILNNVENIGSGFAHGYADGFLPANSMITFTYNTPILPPGSVQAIGAHSSVSGNVLTNILSLNGVNSGSSFQLAPFFMPTAFVPPSVWPVMTIVGPATAVIKNLSDGTAYFSSYFLSLIGLSLPGDASSYVVSAVPLPPALLLMLASMVGLGGFAARKRMAKASS